MLVWNYDPMIRVKDGIVSFSNGSRSKCSWIDKNTNDDLIASFSNDVMQVNSIGSENIFSNISIAF